MVIIESCGMDLSRKVMGLSSRFTHVLILTGLNRPWGYSVRICIRVPSSCSGRHLLRSFNGPELGGLESTEKKVKERERG